MYCYKEKTMSSIISPTQFVPETVAEFVRQQVAELHLQDETEYFFQLAEKERLRKLKENLDQSLIEAIEAPARIPCSPEFWEDMRRRVREHLDQTKKRG